MKRKLEITHRGDYLTFATLATSLGIRSFLPRINRCERFPGVFRRHPGHFASRSSISRDGYIGLLHLIKSSRTEHLPMLNRIISAGWRRWWNFDTMPELKASSDYTNMWPLIPAFYALKWNVTWPLIFLPMIAIGKAKTGFRAHLLATGILFQLRCGHRSIWHKWSMKRLVKYNPTNPWFILLLNKVSGKSEYNFNEVMELFEDRIGCHGWGSCEPFVFRLLCAFTHNMRLK